MVAAPILETPSKVAAAALDKLDLTKPISSLTDKLNAAKEFVVAPATKNESSKKHKSADQVDELQNDGRDRFVGNPAITCDADEPILKANDKRFVLFPILPFRALLTSFNRVFHQIWGQYKRAEASFWTAEEMVRFSRVVLPAF
jgi:ribonucleoside-diphosphate reductase subunit M2